MAAILSSKLRRVSTVLLRVPIVVLKVATVCSRVSTVPLRVSLSFRSSAIVLSMLPTWLKILSF